MENINPTHPEVFIKNIIDYSKLSKGKEIFYTFRKKNLNFRRLDAMI